MTDVDMGTGNLTGVDGSSEVTDASAVPDLTVEPGPQQPKKVLYDEWRTYPDLKIFLPVNDGYDDRAGWWCDPWRGDEAAVRALGYEPGRLIRVGQR